MDIQTIRSWRLAHPFEPFTIVLNNGRRLPVVVPYALAISPTGSEVAYGDEAEGPLFIPVHEVMSIERGAMTSKGISA